MGLLFAIIDKRENLYYIKDKLEADYYLKIFTYQEVAV